MEYYNNYMVGIVINCPMTKHQIALHINNVTFRYWDSGLMGHEVDIGIDCCPSCKTKHLITVPLQG